jgi:carbonic anhydrase
MRLFEAILDANHRAVAGDANAGVHPADFADELPVIALTCIDPRLNALFPNVLGIPGDQFIWLRNAGNIITGTMTSTMRSLALACAVKEGREIAIIGHTDCHVRQTTALQLLEELKGMGVDRHQLPENINEFFGMFASERQNVIKSCGFARQSPLIGPQIPVHGFMVDIQTGKLEWIVNGYENWQAVSQTGHIGAGRSATPAIGALGALAAFDMGDMKFPDQRIGDAAGQKGLGDIKPMVSGATAPVPRPEPPPVISAGSPKTPLPPPSNWLRPGATETPAAAGKKPLPPPIRPRFVGRDPKR